jgi:hypothetical protein
MLCSIAHPSLDQRRVQHKSFIADKGGERNLLFTSLNCFVWIMSAPFSRVKASDGMQCESTILTCSQ